MEARRHLWERDQQLSAAAALLDAAPCGQGQALFLLGEAGLGKTSLLERVCAEAEHDVVVARAYCDPMETSLPFGVVWQIVHALGGDVAGTSEEDPIEARRAFLYRTLRWLEGVARSPLLVAVDDLHWGDPDSLVFVGLLCRRLTQLRLAFVASLRPWPAAAAQAVWSVVDRGDAAIEPLAPLSQPAAADALAERLGRPVPHELARREWGLTGGNPLLLDLVARRLDEAITSTDADDVPDADVERSLVLTRFAGLSPHGMRWARAATVLGLRFRADVVGEVAGLEGDSVEAAADAVWRGGLVRAGREGWAEFVHPLFWQLLYDDMAPPVRARFHARAFTALLERGMEDAAAEHAVRADLAGDLRAVRVLTEDGQRALRAGAPAAAVSRLESAVRLSGSGARAPLVQLGEAYMAAARGPQATSTLLQALDTDLSVAERVAAHTLLSRAHFGQGDFDGATAALQAAVALAEHECPEMVVRPLLRHAYTVIQTEGPVAALPMAARALELSQGADPVIRRAARAAWGGIAYMGGDPDGLVVAEAEARRVLDARAAEVAADLRSGIAGTVCPFAMAASYAEGFADADAILRSAIDEAERAGLVTIAGSMWIPLSLMLARTRSMALLPVADRLLALVDHIPLVEPFARTLRSYELLELGEDEQSEAEQARARRLVGSYRIWLCLLWLDHIEGMRSLRKGQFRSASDLYLGLEERYRSLGVAEPCVVPFGRHAALAHSRAGRLEDAERLVAWLDERAHALPCCWPAAGGAAGRAELAVARGDLATASEQYRTAVELLAGVTLPLEQAEIAIEHGTVLRHHGRPREARESFRRAAASAESGGGTWLARRAGEELAAAGGRRRQSRGAHELTPQERRAARLAATGASDKDIAAQLAVSVPTVRTHLDRVYAKLGVHSRRELMAMGDQLETIIDPIR